MTSSSGQRLRYVLRPREEVGRPELEVLSVYRDHGVVPKSSRDDNFNKTPLDLSRYQVVRSGDLVVNKMKAWQGSIAVSRFNGIVSPDYLVCSVDSSVDARYLHFLLRSAPLVNEYRMRSKGIRPAQWRLYWEDLAEVQVNLPQLADQRRIANFLDVETTRIDHLIKERIHQTELLGRRLRSWLSELSDGLIGEFGEVRLRYLIESIEQGWSPQCEDRPVLHGEWGVVKAGCVNTGIFDGDQHKALPADVRPRTEYQLRSGDLLVSRASGSLDLIGSAAVIDSIDKQLLLCDKVYRLKVDGRRAQPWFIAFMLRSHSVREHIKVGISGAEGMANNLPTSVIKDCGIPNVPVCKQVDVVKQIQVSQIATDRARAALRRAHTLLNERRQSLITAVVTGQIDVSTASGRGAQE